MARERASEALFKTPYPIDDAGKERLIVAKSRRGRPGFVGLRFHGPTGRFYSSDTATAAFGPGKREAEIERLLLEAIQRAPLPLTKEEAAARVPRARKAVRDVLERLVEAGDLELRPAVRRNAAGQQRPVKVVGMPKQESGDADE